MTNLGRTMIMLFNLIEIYLGVCCIFKNISVETLDMYPTKTNK
jgi:hypothetical protein